MTAGDPAGLWRLLVALVQAIGTGLETLAVALAAGRLVLVGAGAVAAVVAAVALVLASLALWRWCWRWSAGHWSTSRAECGA